MNYSSFEHTCLGSITPVSGCPACDAYMALWNDIAKLNEQEAQRKEKEKARMLVLEYPLSANRYWRPVNLGKHVTIVPTKEAKQYKAGVAWAAQQARLPKLTGRVALTIELFPNRPQDWKTRQRKQGDTWADSVQCIDLGNCEKVLSDALNGIAWVDDKQLWQIQLIKREPDEHGARCHVTIREIAVQTQGGLL